MTVPLILPPTSPLISEPNAVVLDASWLYEPDPPDRNAYEEFRAGPRLPRARFWDLDAVSEPHPDGYPLMLPSPERFAAFAGKHGVTKDSHVIVYDGEGVFAAPRTAWTFKVYGHENVSVINGGLPRAKKEGVKLETGPPTQFEVGKLLTPTPSAHFAMRLKDWCSQETQYPVPILESDAVVSFDEVLRLANRPSPSNDSILLIDARPAPSYQDGHIPTSFLLDFPSSLLQDPGNFTYLREPEDLKRHVGEQLGQDQLDQIISGKATAINTCGGGLSAAINWLSLLSLGVNSRLYDEAWAGYSARKETPRVTGPDPL